MSSFTDDIRYGFIRRHGALGEIIALNLLIFLVSMLVNATLFLSGVGGVLELYIRQYMGLPADIWLFLLKPWTLFTYQWFHSLSDLLHVVFNMLWLFWIGRILREYQGDRKIWSTFYLGSLAAGLLYLLLENTLPIFRETLPVTTLIGASGGVTAVIVATATLVPEYRISLLFFGAVRLKWIALVMVLMDILFLPNGNAGGRFAHLGGALYGFLFITYLRKGVNLAAPFDWLLDTAKDLVKGSGSPGPKPKVRVVRNQNVGKGGRQGSAGQPNRPSQEEIDRILEKINRVGYDGLTKEEKQTLFNASR